jgi:two-component system response regulator NreC
MKEKEVIRIFIVEDHTIVRVIMDLFLEGLNGIEAIRRIKTKVPGTRILVLSMYGNEEYIISSIRSGADGYLMKGSGISEINKAIRCLMKGGKYFSQKIAEKIVSQAVNGKKGKRADHEILDILTLREKEVLQLIAEGKSSVMIGKMLDISTKTVESHRYNLMSKLNIRNVAGLVRFAISAGLISIE